MQYLVGNGNSPMIIDNSGKYFIYELPPIPPTPLMFFTTESVDNSVFNTTFTVSSGVLNWNLGDASNNVNANYFSHTYTSPGNKTINVYKGTTNGSTAITGISLADDKLVGTLDVSNFSFLNNINVTKSRKLTSILHPISDPSAAIFSQYIIDDCSIKSLDLRGLTKLGGSFQLSNLQDLKTILNPVSSQTFTQYWINTTGLTGTLDCSGLTGLGGSFFLTYNTSLNNVLLPTTSNIFTQFVIQNTDISTINLSGLSKLGSYVSIISNPRLASIILPVSTQAISTLSLSNNDLTGTIDCSGLNLTGTINIASNPKLKNVIFPTTSVQASLSINDCSIQGTLDLSKLAGGLKNQFYVYSNKTLTGINFPTTNGATAISDFRAQGCNLIGTIDVSRFSFNGTFTIDSNPSLNKIIFPNTCNLTYFTASNCGLTTLDVSNLKLLSAMSVYSNPNLIDILLPDTSIAFSSLQVDDCCLGPTLDLRNLHGGVQYTLSMANNKKLTNIIFPDSSIAIQTIYANNCNLTTVDISSLKNWYGNLRTYSNSQLQNLILPDTLTGRVYYFECQNCSLNTISVDSALHKIRLIYDTLVPLYASVINLSGGGNSVPTDGSLNVDISILKYRFSQASVPLTITYNT